MKYSFDDYGWYSLEEIPNRQTDIIPPPFGNKIVGEPYPNFTGYEWILLPYVTPIPINIVEPTEPIAIDVPIKSVDTSLTFLEFMMNGIFTDEEVIAIYAKSKEDSQMGLMVYITLDGFKQANGIELHHPNTLRSFSIWVMAGVITQERINEILA